MNDHPINIPPSPTGPIFVRGMSRSGGTLTVTILDAHPAISMSYELYPNLLDYEAEKEPALQRIRMRIRDLFASEKERLAALPPSLRKFLAYAARSGIDKPTFDDMLRRHRDSGLGLDTPAGRLKLVETCALYKMRNEGKPIWGSKCTSRFEEYASVWPNARFLNVVRDGRDVLASQLNTGSFHPDPAKLGESWAKHHTRFKSLVDQGIIKGYAIRYENLVANPEPEIRAICDFLELDFSPSMLNHHQQELTIYKSNHISMPQIVNPINTSKTGRWKKDLSAEQLAQFEAAAGDCLAQFGYERSGNRYL